MLYELAIENLAVIEKAVVVLGGGLNVFSGETGAGKSVLVGGINAVLGGRVSRDSVRAGAEKAVVTALFTSLSAAAAAPFIEAGYCERVAVNSGESGADETVADENSGISAGTAVSENNVTAEYEIVITREIYAGGKSAARVNGRSITAAMLKEYAAGLVDIHGQHDTIFLTAPQNQLDLVDTFVDAEVIGSYQSAFALFRSAAGELKKAEKAGETREYRLRELEVILAELSEYDFAADDGEVIGLRIERLREQAVNADGLAAAHAALAGDDDTDGAAALIGVAVRKLTEIGAVALAERLGTAAAEVADISGMLTGGGAGMAEIGGGIGFASEEDLALLPELELKADFLRHIEKKYSLTVAELHAKKGEWEREKQYLDEYASEVGALSAAKHERGEVLKKAGAVLTAARTAAGARLSALLREELVSLDMANAAVEFAVTPDKVTRHGMDKVEMLLSFNAGEPLKPAGKVASGGELSRVMLAIKSLQSSGGSGKVGDNGAATMIFDEIDTGISGRAAAKVGYKMKRIAAERQVLCVTHLARIAAAADTHFLIAKREDPSGGRTYTRIASLDVSGRRGEIARIISGDENAPAALANADELMREMCGAG